MGDWYPVVICLQTSNAACQSPFGSSSTTEWSKDRAAIARSRAAARERQRETESGDIHRCGNCDGNLAAVPDLPYCSDACRRQAEASTRPTLEDHTEPSTARTAPPRRVPAEQRARETTVGPVEARYDERYREIEPWIPNAGNVRKDDRVADAYEDERPADHFTDERDDATEFTGRRVRDDDHERIALEPLDPHTLCVACNLPRTRTEQGSTDSDGRCTECAERDRVPLSVIQDEVRKPDSGSAAGWAVSTTSPASVPKGL